MRKRKRPGERKRLGTRITDWAKRSPWVAIFTVLGIFLTAGVTVGALIKGGVYLYKKEFRWRQAAYAKLESLRAGFTFAQFTHTLGSPLFAYTNHSGLVESIFRGRDYWVQTISNTRGNVVLYAVTSCNSDFTPRFVLPPYEKKTPAVILNRTVPAKVLPTGLQDTVRAQYFGSGATADEYYYDVYYGANPGYYKAYAWGINDACPGWYRERDALDKRGVFPEYPKRFYHGYVLHGGGSIARFRATVPVNTYAETAPLELFPAFDPGKHIGADRILIRSVAGEG